MKLDTFFEKFDLFADAPEAVAKMRELVLQLAVRGKLVEQDPHDGDADSLLEAIAFARKANGRRRGADSAGEVELLETERWHDVPSSWRWVRLETVGDVVGGGTPRSENSDYFAEEGIPWLTPADLNGFKNKRILRGKRCITQLGLENSSAQLLPEGSVLFSSRAPIGYVAIAGTELATNQGFKSCVPFVKETNEFLYYYLMSAAARIDSEASGTTFREVSGRIVSQIPVPLPPLAEQNRIVVKVDELMALCDRLEAQQQEREMRHVALVRASLARFADAPTPANLNILFHESYSIPPAELRKSILALAVQGKLVPQDQNDEPAETLVQQIAKERHNKVESSDPDSHGVLEPVGESEAPFELPPSWQWVRLGEIVAIKHGYAFSSESFTSVETMFVLTTPGNFYERGGFRDRGPKTKYYNGPVPPGFILETGDLIIPMTEQAAGLLGSPAFIPGDGKTYLHNQRLGKLSFYSESIAPEFVFWFFNCDFFRDALAKTCTGMKVRHTSPKKILKVPFPLCSFAEQRRIVAKVDELMALVDALETQLATARGTGSALVEAVVVDLRAQA